MTNFRTLLAAAVVTLCSYAKAQTATPYWQQTTTVDKTEYNAIMRGFMRTRTMWVGFDYTNAMFCDLTRDDCIADGAPDVGLKPKALDGLLQRYQQQLYRKIYDLTFVDPEVQKPDYGIIIAVKFISDKGGIDARAYIVYREQLCIASFNVDIDDGRWNTMPRLLVENGEKQAKLLHNNIYDLRIGSPNFSGSKADYRKQLLKQ